MSRSKRLAVTVVLCVFASAAASGGEDDVPELVPGRPGFTESPGTVGHTVVQFEGGVPWSVERSGSRQRGLMLPDGLLRLGLCERFELRAGGTPLMYESFQEGP